MIRKFSLPAFAAAFALAALPALAQSNPPASAETNGTPAVGAQIGKAKTDETMKSGTTAKTDKSTKTDKKVEQTAQHPESAGTSNTPAKP
ncbi:MAG TPA: hypothetical protein VN832_02075 [Stellaceae bacterium]|nr:hypothetical protein [Stellaceae bacterium]